MHAFRPFSSEIPAYDRTFTYAASSPLRHLRALNMLALGRFLPNPAFFRGRGPADTRPRPFPGISLEPPLQYLRKLNLLENPNFFPILPLFKAAALPQNLLSSRHRRATIQVPRKRYSPKGGGNNE